MSNAGWCCSNEDGNGMWYTPEYPEEVFFEHWTFMAERYLDNPLVIGADLRNEVRGIKGEGYRPVIYSVHAHPISFRNESSKKIHKVVKLTR